MIDKLKSLFTPSKPDASVDSGFDPVALALTALMFEAARADNVQTDKETALIKRALVDGLALNDADAEALAEAASDAQKNAVDLHQFTKQAKSLDLDEKIAFIETLWRIVLSDDDRDPYEDAVIRRISALMYVSDQQSGAARQRVLATQ